MQILTTIPDRGPYKNPENAKIVERFFIALESLITPHRIRGVKTFTDIYGINRMNLYQLKKDMGRGIFKPAWLSYMVRDFGISAEWLLTGTGTIFK